MDDIVIRGARQHNLKNIDVCIPRGKLTVITGPSGSGKSSLAFQTLYAEGQRRYVESLSAYARQFLEQFDQPDVDSIEGLSPAIAIEQKTGGVNPRSTIATATEIYDYLRILYAAAGVPHDPVTGEKLEKMSSADIVAALSQKPERAKIILLAPVDITVLDDISQLIGDLQRQGYIRVRIDGELRDVDELQETDLEGLKRLEVVVDRLVVREGVEPRLADSVEMALRLCGAQCVALVQQVGEEAWIEYAFMTSYRNPSTGYELAALTPKHFSFNAQLGACPDCHGLGSQQFCDRRLLVPDESLSLSEGALKIWGGTKKKKGWAERHVEGLAQAFAIDMDEPFQDLDPGFVEALFDGHDEEITVIWERDGQEIPLKKSFEGIAKQVERLYRDTESAGVKKSMGKYMNVQQCRSCGGQRLKKEMLAVKLPFSKDQEQGEDLGIMDFCALPVENSLELIEQLELPTTNAEVTAPIAREVKKRLGFLQRVGLGYLSLDRTSGTLSGGETQRIRLAQQLGASLSGVIYVLDEPSVGLHQEDNAKLIEALRELRDIGNTVVVVEHDEETIRAADWLIDIGPAAGEGGGELLFEGKPSALEEHPETPTGSALQAAREFKLIQKQWRASKEQLYLEVLGAAEHNLQSIDVRFPLGQLVSVTGASGSGKSTLVHDILYSALARKLNRRKVMPGKHRDIKGIEHLEKVIVVDQSALGKSPRSNAATYTGALDLIRGLFAKLPLSKQRGYQAGRFSFNVKGGRCEKCSGDGAIKIDMHFLADAYVTCDACGGRRYNRETLEVTYKGRNIAQVLDMTALEAKGFFENVPKLREILAALCDVGLGYLRLGQAANTLSGGEAQRVKLANELSRPSAGNSLYILDEPTTGLHFKDIQILMLALKKLRDAGNSLIVIEHNLDVIRESDYIIDLGPGGGKHGGKIVAEGSPSDVAGCADSLTGKWLCRLL